jgi:hypothetical protein
MPDKTLLRVFCSKTKSPHVVGTVHSDRAGGYELRYKSHVRVAFTGREGDDFEAMESVFRPDPDGVTAGFDAYCAACGLSYFVYVDQIFHSASRGAKSFKLHGRNAEAKYRGRT